MVFTTASLITTIVEIPFIFVHISILIVLITQLIKKNADFTEGFYILFVIVSINDLLLYLNDAIFLKFPDYGWFSDFYLSPTLNNFLARFGNIGVAYTFYFNIIGYTILSFNRFTAFFFPFKHSQIWRSKNVLLLTISNILICLILISYRIPFDATYSWSTDKHDEMFPSYVNQSVWLPRFIVGGGINIFTCLLKSMLDISSVMKYRQLSRTLTGAQLKKGHKDMQLLMHSLLILCCHLYYAVYYIMEFFARVSENNSLTIFWLNSMTLVDDIMVLTSPVFLFILSSNVRKAYLKFYGLRQITKLINKIDQTHYFQSIVKPAPSRNF